MKTSGTSRLPGDIMYLVHTSCYRDFFSFFLSIFGFQSAVASAGTLFLYRELPSHNLHTNTWTNVVPFSSSFHLISQPTREEE
ncbi:Adaptin ear-binding coat-associated protein 1 NECAP-1, partial [Zea mays]